MTKKILTGYPSIDKPWMQYYSPEAQAAVQPQCTMFEMLWKNNMEYLENIALNYYGRQFTYGQLFAGIERAAKAFTALGVKAGDVVALCTVNTPEMVYAFYGLNRLGVVANMVDPRTDLGGLQKYFEETKVRVVLVVEPAYPAIVKAMQGTEVEYVVVISPADSLPQHLKFLYRVKNKAPTLRDRAMNWREFERRGVRQTPIYPPYKADNCCVIAHTGGTTGSPKSVLLTNDNFNAVTHGYQFLGIDFRRGHRYFNDLPPFIMYGLCLSTHTTLCYGLEVILYPVFDSKGFPKQFAKFRPQHFSALIDHLRYLVGDKRTMGMDMSKLITAAAGGDAVNPNLEKQINEFLHRQGCPYEMVKGYGMTELSATAITTSPKANAIGSVGIPLIQNTIKVMDTDTLEELPCGKIGELWVSGPSVMLGYYQKPEETAEVLVTDEDGRRWIRTGDLVHIREDGLVFHEGRIRRIYMTSFDGQPAKIFPLLVEGVLEQSPRVEDCAVVGRKRPHSDYYEAVAYVVRKDGSDKNSLMKELMALCNKAVPTYMIPAEIRFIDQMPRTPIGKVDFVKLEHEV